MISRIETFFRRLRRGISRSEWLVKLCGLSLSEGTADDPGLVMVQIDGLSYSEFHHALDAGRMPFLKRLIERDDYRVHLHYSGLPSTTPAVQGEIFYGRRSAVPAFFFRHRRTGDTARMYDPETVARVERELQREHGEGLAAGGSVYADIYTGGAAEPHFCPSAEGMRSPLADIHPLTLGLLFFANLFAFLRVGVLVVMETGLAIFDFVKGITNGHHFFRELKFVPTRVAICILLRELIVIGAKLDLVRGLPVIHLNLLGYDEQAHRRGPDSVFARWTLQGIDDAIVRIWRSARRTKRRDYELWVYSDHGQERTRPYENVTGRSIQEAVTAILNAHPGDPPRGREKDDGAYDRSRGRAPIARRKPPPPPTPEPSGNAPDPEFRVVALGPVGCLYASRRLTGDELRHAAVRLVAEARVPLVAGKIDSRRLKAWTNEGEFDLPEEADRVFGADHPFLKEIRGDLPGWFSHPDTGDLMLFGWRHGAQAITFAQENGSHAGASPCETSGFALLPVDAPLPAAPGRPDHLRPGDLREAALRLLGRADKANAGTSAKGRTRRPPDARRVVIRLMTYNAHSCVGLDRRTSPERISRVIARCSPDIVALQELDAGRARSGGTDQAHLIARHLEMDFHFHPAMQIEEEHYGDAILTHLPMRLIHASRLPGLPGGGGKRETRGALWVAIDAGGCEIQVINTHLGLSSKERSLQAEALLGEEWLGHPACRSPVILCGDLNALPSSRVCRKLKSRLRDVQLAAGLGDPRPTFTSRFPKARIDHVFVDDSIRVRSIEAPSSELARVSSDHLPLVVDLEIPVTVS